MLKNQALTGGRDTPTVVNTKGAKVQLTVQVLASKTWAFKTEDREKSERVVDDHRRRTIKASTVDLKSSY